MNQKLVILTKATILFFALWIGYVLILLAVPDVFNGDTLSKGSLRLAIRLVLWTIPVVYYARATEQQSYWSFIELKTNWKRGFIGGGIFFWKTTYSARLGWRFGDTARAGRPC